MPHVEVREGLTISYALAGPEGAPVLVLLTGLGGLKEGWFRQVPAFSDVFRVLTLDNRGMGGTSVLDAPTRMADLAEDVVLLLDALGIERAHVWGVSMGGKIAMELALGWPERVERLVLENTTAGEAHRLDREGDSPLRRAGTLDADGWLREIVPLLFAPDYRERNAGSMRALARSRERNPPDPRGLARQWEAYEGFDAWDRLPAVRNPTLVLVGAEDALTDPANGEALAGRIPGARFVAIAGGGHSVHIEKPDVVNEAVRAFLTA